MSTALTTLDTIIKAIQGMAGAMDGMRPGTAPDYPPDQIAAYPFAITYASSGLWKWTAYQVITGLHDIICEIHIARIDLPRDVERAMPYGERFVKAVFDDPTLSAAFNSGAVMGPISYTFGLLGYFGQSTIGWQFTIENVKTQGATS